MAGKSIFVNGVQVQPGEVPLPAKVNGKYYFHFTAGEHPWASALILSKPRRTKILWGFLFWVKRDSLSGLAVSFQLS